MELVKHMETKTLDRSDSHHPDPLDQNNLQNEKTSGHDAAAASIYFSRLF